MIELIDKGGEKMLFKPMNKSSGRQEMLLNDPEIINFLKPNDYISADDALKHSDLFAVVHLISSDMASAKLFTEDKTLGELLKKPVLDTSKYAFWQSMYSQLLLTGNSYAYIWRNRNGRPMYLEYLRPSQVSVWTVYENNQRDVIYSATFDNPSIGYKEVIPASDMIHLKIMSTDGGKTGNTPLMSLAPEMNIQDSSTRLTVAALANSILPQGILKITKGGGLLDAKQKKQERINFVKANQGDALGGPIVLDELREYTPLEIKNDVSKLLTSTDWTSEQISKVFLVPSDMLGSESQHSNIEQVAGQYNATIGRYIRPVVSELENTFFTTVHFDVKEIIDIDGHQIENRVSNLRKNNVISSELAQKILLRSHSDILLKEDVEAVLKEGGSLLPTTNSTLKGGEEQNDSEN